MLCPNGASFNANVNIPNNEGKIEGIDTFPNVAVGLYIIKDAQILDEHSVDLTYYVGDEWKEKEPFYDIENNIIEFRVE